MVQQLMVFMKFPGGAQSYDLSPILAIRKCAEAIEYTITTTPSLVLKLYIYFL